jgi:predicted transcriptional regulator
MEIVWRRDRAAVREVHEALAERALAYTTVMTTMSRLHQKGLLVREPESNYYVYAPAMTREEFAERVAAAVLDGLLEDFARPALAHLVDRVGEADEPRLRELEEIIRRRRRDVKPEGTG